MKRSPVTSSNIKSIGYDPEKNTLHVEFHGGRVYEYKDVPAKVHSELVGADSIGSYFGKNIRMNYGCSLLPREDE